MASDAKTDILFGGSQGTTIGSGSSATSDQTSVSDGVLQAVIEIMADNTATSPSTGDTLEVVMTYSIGDIDGDGNDDYTTEQHSYSVVLNTNDEDPATALVQLPLPINEVQLIANNNAGSNSIELYASLYEQTA